MQMPVWLKKTIATLSIPLAIIGANPQNVKAENAEPLTKGASIAEHVNEVQMPSQNAIFEQVNAQINADLNLQHLDSLCAEKEYSSEVKAILVESFTRMNTNYENIFGNEYPKEKFLNNMLESLQGINRIVLVAPEDETSQEAKELDALNANGVNKGDHIIIRNTPEDVYGLMIHEIAHEGGFKTKEPCSYPVSSFLTTFEEGYCSEIMKLANPNYGISGSGQTFPEQQIILGLNSDTPCYTAHNNVLNRAELFVGKEYIADWFWSKDGGEKNYFGEFQGIIDEKGGPGTTEDLLLINLSFPYAGGWTLDKNALSEVKEKIELDINYLLELKGDSSFDKSKETIRASEERISQIDAILADKNLFDQDYQKRLAIQTERTKEIKDELEMLENPQKLAEEKARLEQELSFLAQQLKASNTTEEKNNITSSMDNISFDLENLQPNVLPNYITSLKEYIENCHEYSPEEHNNYLSEQKELSLGAVAYYNELSSPKYLAILDKSLDLSRQILKNMENNRYGIKVAYEMDNSSVINALKGDIEKASTPAELFNIYKNSAEYYNVYLVDVGTYNHNPIDSVPDPSHRKNFSNKVFTPLLEKMDQFGMLPKIDPDKKTNIEIISAIMGGALHNPCDSRVPDKIDFSVTPIGPNYAVFVKEKGKLSSVILVKTDEEPSIKTPPLEEAKEAFSGVITKDVVFAPGEAPTKSGQKVTNIHKPPQAAPSKEGGLDR